MWGQVGGSSWLARAESGVTGGPEQLRVPQEAISCPCPAGLWLSVSSRVCAPHGRRRCTRRPPPGPGGVPPGHPQVHTGSRAAPRACGHGDALPPHNRPSSFSSQVAPLALQLPLGGPGSCQTPSLTRFFGGKGRNAQQSFLCEPAGHRERDGLFPAY